MTIFGAEFLLPENTFLPTVLNTSLDRLPFPVRLLSSHYYAEDFAAAQRTAHAELEKPGNSGLKLAIEIIRNPELRLEIYGRYSAAEQQQEVRILVCRNDQQGVFVVQYPDANVLVRLCRIADLPTLILDGLPAVRPGARLPATIVNGEIDEEAYANDDPLRPQPRFYSTEPESPSLDLHIQSYPCPYHGPQILRASWRLFDLADGRYLDQEYGNETQRRPGTRDDVLALLKQGVYLEPPWTPASSADT